MAKKRANTNVLEIQTAESQGSQDVALASSLSAQSSMHPAKKPPVKAYQDEGDTHSIVEVLPDGTMTIVTTTTVTTTVTTSTRTYVTGELPRVSMDVTGLNASAAAVAFEPVSGTATKAVAADAPDLLYAQEHEMRQYQPTAIHSVEVRSCEEKPSENPSPKIPAKPLAYRFIKRAFDIIGSAVAMIIFSPLLGFLAIAVRVTSPGPAIFRQERYGRNYEPFICYKFRTMKVDAPRNIPTSVMAENPDVMTPIGATLRKWSLDELPQLLNIFKGDMSFIGPRPMILSEKYQVVAREAYGANDIRPGLSGWAQVNGRDVVSVEEKARLDGYYRANMSISLDVYVFFKSIVVALTRSGYKGVSDGRSRMSESKQGDADQDEAR